MSCVLYIIAYHLYDFSRLSLAKTSFYMAEQSFKSLSLHCYIPTYNAFISRYPQFIFEKLRSFLQMFSVVFMEINSPYFHPGKSVLGAVLGSQ